MLSIRIDYYPKSSSPTNFLFRGNMPVINNTFAYKEIMETMSEIVVKKNFTFPQNPSLIVVRSELKVIYSCWHFVTINKVP